MTLPRRRFIALAGALCAGGAAAQDAAPLQTAWVKTGLYVVSGGGGNALLRFSAQGSVLVDGQLPGRYRALMQQVRRTSRLSDLPLRALVLTSHHPAHAGTAPDFLAAGVPLIVQANVRQRLAATTAQTVITYQRRHELRFGGVALDLLHFGPGVTDGDTVVHLADLGVVAVGDLYTTARPEPDTAAGGSLAGWARALDGVLQLDFDRVVPGVGPVVGRAELQAFRQQLGS